MKALLKILIGIGIAYAGYCLLLFALQRAVLFPRYMIPGAEDKGPAPFAVEKLLLPMSFGRVEAWYLPPSPPWESASHPVVIFAHGNAERIEDCALELQPFTRWGIGVLLVEFPGYGRSEGAPSQHTIAATFATAYDAVLRRPGTDPRRIILYGRSLGGGAVCTLLKQRPAAALILASTFTSVRSFARRYLAPSFLIRDPFDNLAAVAGFAGPVLIFHGEQDEVIPHRHGVALAEAARDGKFVSYACGHNDCPPDPSHFWGTIKDFLSSKGLLATAAQASEKPMDPL